MKRGKGCVWFVFRLNLFIFSCLLISEWNNIVPQKCKFWRCCCNSPPFLSLFHASLNWGSHCKFSLTLSILSETRVSWCEYRSSRYSKCHSKLITSVWRPAVLPSCFDLEKMEGKAMTSHRVLWRRKRSKCGYAQSCHSFDIYIDVYYSLLNFTLFKW